MKKKVVFELKDLILPFTIVSEHDNSKIPEEHVKKIALEKLNEILQTKVFITNKIKSKKIKIYDDIILDESQIFPGRIIKTIENELGIVTHLSVSEKGVGVILSGHRIRYYKPYELLDTNVPFEEARCLRMDEFRQEGMWHEGDTGWVFINGQYHPVVIGKFKRGKYLLHKVTNDPSETKKWEVCFRDINKFLCEFRTAAEEKQYLSVDEVIAMYRSIMDNGKNSKIAKVELLIIFLKKIYSMQPLLRSNASPAFKEYLKTIDKKYDVLLDKIQLDSTHALLDEINMIPDFNLMEA